MVSRMKSVQLNGFSVVDEFNSTMTCISCFSATTKQAVRRNKIVKTMKGAVICINTKCPRRITNRATINPDQNRANNIGLIGFSSVVFVDNLSLPLFRRNKYNSNKYDTERYQHASLPTLASPVDPVNPVTQFVV